MEKNVTKSKDGPCYWTSSPLIPFLPETAKPYQYLPLRSGCTESRKAEKKLIRVNLLYKFINHINKSIVQISNEHELFDKACSLAINIGQFKIAWIGMLDENDMLNIVSMRGEETGSKRILKMSSLNYNDPSLAYMPLVKALKTGKYAINNNIQADPALEQWKDEFIHRGIFSCISVPIFKFGKIAGIFGFHASIIDFFEGEEIALLEEAAEEISLAIENFEKLKKNKETEQPGVISENRFRALIENGSDMKMLTTREGNFIYGSPSVTKVFGYSSQEFLCKSAFDFFHPDDLPDLLKKRAKLLETPGESFNFQYRLLHKNGHWIWCEGNLSNMLHESDINAFVSYFRDITEKKIAEQKQLFEQNNRDALINNTKDLLWSLDTDFKLITCNQPFYEAIKAGTGKELAIGDDVLSVALSQEQANRFRKQYLRAFSGEMFTENEYIEYPVECWLEVSYYPIKNGDQVIGTACHSRDITERKRTERQRDSNELRLNEAQAIAHLGHWELNLETGVSLWSEETCRIYGISPEEKVRSYEDWFSFIHPDDMEIVMAAAKKASETLSDSALTHRILLKDGSVKHIYAKSKFEFNQSGKPVSLYGITLDVTERQLAEQEREKMVSDILLRNKNIEQFSYIVSHNLRAPIANITGLSNILKGDLSEEDKIKSQQYLFKAVEHLDIVIKDLNEILQMKTEISENKKPVCFSELVNDIESSIQNLVQREHVKIIADFSAIDHTTTLKSYIHSVFYNLISNSIKYRKSGVTPIITIKSEVNNSMIRLSFKDNGSGIDLEKHGDKLFGLYKRFHSNVEGKGLGLFMVKNQVEVLGGTISVKSKPGIGTEFTVEIPK